MRGRDLKHAPHSPELSAIGATTPSLHQNTTATARKEKRGKNAASFFLSHHPVFPIWSFFSVSGSKPPKRSPSSWISTSNQPSISISVNTRPVPTLHPACFETLGVQELINPHSITTKWLLGLISYFTDEKTEADRD